MNRRGFLKFAAGGTVGLVASPIIWNTLYDAVYWSQNWGWIPRIPRGDSTYLPTNQQALSFMDGHTRAPGRRAARPCAQRSKDNP